MKSGGLTAWTSAKLRECYSEVELDDEERKGIAQQTLQKITDFFGADQCCSRRTGRGNIVVRMLS